MVFRIGNKILTGKDKNVGIGFDQPTSNNIVSTVKTQVESGVKEGYIKKGGFIVRDGRKQITPDTPIKEIIEKFKQEIDGINTNVIEANCKIFSPGLQTNQWFIDRETLMCGVSDVKTSITIPLVIDTEFTNQSRKSHTQEKRFGLTTQIKGIGTDTLRGIYAHHEIVNKGRKSKGLKPFKTINSDFHPIDYIRECGLIVDTKQAFEADLKSLPKCNFILFGHFLTAEINMICDGSIKERVKQLQRSTGEEQITSGRRAYCQSAGNGIKVDWVSLKHIITIEGVDYEMCLKLVDTGAIHGIASYKDFCESVGWKLEAKDKFTKREKSRMLDMAVERPTDFEEYSLGDLDVYEALVYYHEKWKLVYKILEIPDHYQVPKLTIGGTVKDLFEAMLAAKLGLEAINEDGKNVWRKELTEIVNSFIKPASASHLRQFSTMTRAILAKVEGGRCRNNRPTDVFSLRKIKGKFDACLINDIDIAGCYGEGQRNQGYYIGTPYIFDYEATVKNNEYVSLRKWVTDLGVNIDALIASVKSENYQAWNNQDNWGELISGAWQARISTSEKLEYGQDFFASWFTTTKDNVDLLAKTIRKMKSDSELQDTEWADFDEEIGTLKIFNNEICNGVLTHDGLQWILAVASPRQRNELLDKIQILAGAIYPLSHKIDEKDSVKALQILKEKCENWESKNTTEIVRDELGNLGVDRKMRQCHAWFDINLGDLIVDSLLIERKKAQIQHGKKSPLDVLFKLCVNTLYGDMVSKYFVTSNPVVGNNITARARAMAWYMEKGLHGNETITDGCAYDPNKVMFMGRDRITGECINQHRTDSQLNRWRIKRAPLASVEYLMKHGEVFISENGELKSIGKGENNAFINTKAMEHLQEQFPLVDVLHQETTGIKVNENLEVTYVKRKGQFSFETKDMYHSASYHGSANYLFIKDVILVTGDGVQEPTSERKKEIDSFIKNEKLKELHPYLNIIQKDSPDQDLQWELATFDGIKARGYETKKEHTSVENEAPEGEEIQIYESQRYNTENNPARDFITQLLTNPENVKRQVPAIKQGILKIKEYKNLAGKYDQLGIEPGDTILRTVLMQEFSLSQFTFQTYDQYMMWYGIVTKLKQHDKQSLESYFLNDDETLNFIAMTEKVDQMISEGITKPFDELDKHRHKQRSAKRSKEVNEKGKGASEKVKKISLSHPSLEVYKKLKDTLNESGLSEENV